MAVFGIADRFEDFKSIVRQWVLEPTRLAFCRGRPASLARARDSRRFA
jgi:hypothetical protein